MKNKINQSLGCSEIYTYMYIYLQRNTCKEESSSHSLTHSTSHLIRNSKTNKLQQTTYWICAKKKISTKILC